MQSIVLAVIPSNAPQSPDAPDGAPTNPSVACFGEALVVLVPTAIGPLQDAETFTRGIGGAEVNVAIGLAANGVQADVITRVGDDGFGRHIVAELERFGVGTSAITVDPARATGLYVKEVEATGSRMLYYRTGSAASALSPATLDEPAVRATLRDATLIHTTGITPAISDSAAAAQRVLVDGRHRGQSISFDLNWRPALWRGRERAGAALLGELAGRSDIVLLGADEAATVFGTADPDALRAAIPAPRILVVKNDGGVAIGFDGGDRVEVPARTASVVEAIGAGDAFAAGLLGGILAGVDLSTAIERAHATAILALTGTHDHVGGRE